MDKSSFKDVTHEIELERDRQDYKWGEQNHPSVDPVLANRKGGCAPDQMCEEYEIPSEARAKAMLRIAVGRGECTYTHIALEELCEAVSCKTDEERRGELVQLAAVIVAWIQAIDRRARQ